MRRVVVTDLKRGMVVALPLFNQQGTMLVPSGGRLEEHHIVMLARWGVLEVAIEETSPDATPAAGAESQPGPAGLEERFGKVQGCPLMAELRRSIERFLSRRGAGRVD